MSQGCLINMKAILYSICIRSLALGLTAWGQQVNDTRPDRAKAHRTSTVRATRPANTGAMMGARGYSSTAPYRQRTYLTQRTSSNAVIGQNARLLGYGERNWSSIRYL